VLSSSDLEKIMSGQEFVKDKPPAVPQGGKPAEAAKISAAEAPGSSPNASPAGQTP
jgi:hypothetical protein